MTGNTQLSTVHIPLAILAFAFALFLGMQIGTTKQSISFNQSHIESAQTNIERLKTQETQYSEALKNSETAVEQSKQLQAKLEMLLNDLLELAESDADAQKIVQKWNVKRNAN